MSIDLMFLAHNRREFTNATFATLIDSTPPVLYDHLWILDDASTDGTTDLLHEYAKLCGAKATFVTKKFGAPVAAMNYVLDHTKADVLAKIDNDLVLPPGWLQTMRTVLDAHPTIDVLGMEPGFGGAPAGMANYAAKPAPHVGGIGLFRTRIFKRRRPRPEKRFFGWTQFQKQHARCAWVTPDIRCFLLDHIDVEPWHSLADGYIEKGWARAWQNYFVAGGEYHDWWTRHHRAAA